MTMLFTVFLPFAFVHFITFAILVDEPLQAKSLTSPYFLKKTTRCQLFTFLSHISFSHFHAATHIYKPNSAAFNTA
jgi:tellurite resistance protein TehA-like permease